MPRSSATITTTFGLRGAVCPASPEAAMAVNNSRRVTASIPGGCEESAQRKLYRRTQIATEESWGLESKT